MPERAWILLPSGKQLDLLDPDRCRMRARRAQLRSCPASTIRPAGGVSESRPPPSRSSSKTSNAISSKTATRVGKTARAHGDSGGRVLDLAKRETVASIDCADWLAHQLADPGELAGHR